MTPDESFHASYALFSKITDLFEGNGQCEVANTVLMLAGLVTSVAEEPIKGIFIKQLESLIEETKETRH